MSVGTGRGKGVCKYNVVTKGMVARVPGTGRGKGVVVHLLGLVRMRTGL